MDDPINQLVTPIPYAKSLFDIPAKCTVAELLRQIQFYALSNNLYTSTGQICLNADLKRFFIDMPYIDIPVSMFGILARAIQIS